MLLFFLTERIYSTVNTKWLILFTESETGRPLNKLCFLERYLYLVRFRMLFLILSTHDFDLSILVILIMLCFSILCFGWPDKCFFLVIDSFWHYPLSYEGAIICLSWCLPTLRFLALHLCLKAQSKLWSTRLWHAVSESTFVLYLHYFAFLRSYSCL